MKIRKNTCLLMKSKGGTLLRNHFFMPCCVQLNSVQTNPRHNQRNQCFPCYPVTGCSVFCEYTRKTQSDLNQKMEASIDRTKKDSRIPEQSKLWWLATFRPVSFKSTLKHRPQRHCTFSSCVAQAAYTGPNPTPPKKKHSPTQQKHIETHGCSCNLGSLGK